MGCAKSEILQVVVSMAGVPGANHLNSERNLMRKGTGVILIRTRHRTVLSGGYPE